MFNILKLSDKLSSNQKMIIESTKQFSQTYLKNRVKEDFKRNIIDRNIFKELGRMGILGPTISGYGCIGESYLTYGLMAKEIESIDSGYRSMFSVQSSLVMNPINKYCSEYIKKKYLPKLSSGEFIGSFGLTEPDHGSDPLSMNTTAILDNNNYILNGSKTWITNSPIADVFIIWARCDNTINGFLLDRDMDGITTPTIDGKLSLNTSVTGQIFMDNVIVPKENKLQINGLKGPFTCLNDARLGISFGVLGSAEACIENTIEYVKNRKQFNNYLAEKQLIQYKLSNMYTEYNLALLSCYRVTELLDRDKDNFNNCLISIIKRNSCDKSLNIVRECRDIFGANGISEDYDIFRHLINLETVKTYEGTHDIHSLIIGKYLTGYSSF